MQLVTSQEYSCICSFDFFTHIVNVYREQYGTQWVALPDPRTNVEPVCQLTIKLYTAEGIVVDTFYAMVDVACDAHWWQFVKEEIMVDVVEGFLEINKTEKSVLAEGFSYFACIVKGEDMV